MKTSLLTQRSTLSISGLPEARKDAVTGGFDRVGREHGVAELDQFALYFFLFVG